MVNGWDFNISFLLMSEEKDRFEILKNYPKDGPEPPERQKVVREKDHHESGTGRNDKMKKGGSGKGNWGNPKDDIKYVH